MTNESNEWWSWCFGFALVFVGILYPWILSQKYGPVVIIPGLAILSVGVYLLYNAHRLNKVNNGCERA